MPHTLMEELAGMRKAERREIKKESKNKRARLGDKVADEREVQLVSGGISRLRSPIHPRSRPEGPNAYVMLTLTTQCPR